MCEREGGERRGDRERDTYREERNRKRLRGRQAEVYPVCRLIPAAGRVTHYENKQRNEEILRDIAFFRLEILKQKKKML